MDKRRIYVKKYLEKKGFTYHKKNYLKLINYLSLIMNRDKLDDFLMVISGMCSKKISIRYIDDIIDRYTKDKNVYYYEELFRLDPEWIEFYKENADATGRNIGRENRNGLDKKYVDDILLIKNKVLANKDLDNAIRLHCNIKEKQLLIYHKYTLKDVFKLKKLKLKL